MFGKTETSAIVGVDTVPVFVETDLSAGLPSFDMVGFLSSEVKEARERVRSALKNAGFQLTPGKMTINLSPADLRKQGNSFDLPIAISILVSAGVLLEEQVEPYSFIGELSLDGRLRPVSGAISHVLQAGSAGKKGIVIPKGNVKEAVSLHRIPVFGFTELRDVVRFLISPESVMEEEEEKNSESEILEEVLDFSEILGQESVKRAAEVAAAGMHALLLVGPPGSGKTLTAKRIPTILPPLSFEEQLETTRIHSIAGTLRKDSGLMKIRPFRSPHHTVSASALVGGGGFPKPGEMSLAHNGVLFLDELTEFNKNILDNLRQPLEDHQISIARVHGTYVFPTRVMLVCAMNPCKCGYYPDARCRCGESEVRKYLAKISKPLLDRIDISVSVPQVSIDDLNDAKPGRTSKEIRENVIRAWEIQKERYKNLGIVFNSQLEGTRIREFCILGKEEKALLKQVFSTMNLSARAHDRILKVARTIADLDQSECITVTHLAEAISYRSLDRKFWGDL